MIKKDYSSLCFAFLATLVFLVSISCADEGLWASGPVVKREQRQTIFANEYGEITAARISGKDNGSYLLHSFTLQPNALFLPVILHADMIFYVNTGSGMLSWTEKDELRNTLLKRGDIYRLQQGSVFFIQSHLETIQTFGEMLTIHAIFPKSSIDLHEPTTGPYSCIQEMVTGFDRNVLQAAFQVPVAVIDELLNASENPALIRGVTGKMAMKRPRNMEVPFIRSTTSYNMMRLNGKKKSKMFNFFEEDKDVENCNGWRTGVTPKELSALRDTNIGVFMVNLTAGSMMSPHWNPMSTEVALVLQGQGMIQVVCADVSTESSCKNTRFNVQEGDVFVLPKFHPAAQMTFNYDTLVFMGFTSLTEKTYDPEYLAGKMSVLRTLGSDILAMAFNVPNTTLEQFLAPKKEYEILACLSCAEEELMVMQQEEGRGQGEEPQGGGSKEQPMPYQPGGGSEEQSMPYQPGGGSEEQPMPYQPGGGGPGGGGWSQKGLNVE